MFRWLRPKDSPAPNYEPTWAAFLEQGRWLLEEERRRSAAFQANAVALLGFAGVVLGILVTNDFLAGAAPRSFVGIMGRVAAGLIAVSALVAMLVLIPTRTNSVNTDDAINWWAKFHANEAGDYKATQHFAHMLLAIDPTPVGRDGKPAKRNKRETQALRAARRLAGFRGTLTGTAAVLLAAGVVALTIVVVAPHPSAVVGPPTTTPPTATAMP